MILSLGEMSMENLPDGGIRIVAFGDDAARDLLQQEGKIRGTFGFGSVPSERKDTTFRDILSAIQVRTGVQIDPAIFFIRDGDMQFPVPSQILRISREAPMLHVSYGFTMEPGKSLFEGMKVTPDTLSFRFISLED